jgi:HlyD family secretion protein
MYQSKVVGGTNSGFAAVRWLVIVAFVLALGGGGYWYWKHPREKDPEFKTAPVTRGDMVQLVTATGQLNPMTNVVVGSQVSGIISKLFVDYNSPVTNHEVIAQLDPANYQAQANVAKADLASAKAALELAQAEEKRAKSLYEAKIVAGSDYDTATATLHQAEATVQMKEAALQQAQVNLAYTTIYAPVDGVVLSRSVDVGQTVAASLSAPTLYIIANDLARMQIDALVSEADIGGVDTNQPVKFSVDAFPSRTFHGLVIQIRNSPQTNQNVVTYDTVIAVDNADGKLRPGMTANVSIITAQTNGVLRIPNGALRFHPPEAADAKKGAGAETNGAAQYGGGMRADAGPGSAQGRPGGGFGNGGGGRPGGPGGAGGTGGGKPRGERSSHTIYVLTKQADGKETPNPIQIRTGINDGIYTQVVDGLKESDEVIVGLNVVTAESAQGSSNPFGGGMRRF